MEFQKQQIVIPLQNQKDGTVFDRIIDATVDVGSGLAYHHPQFADGEEVDLYVLMHVSSGYRIVDYCFAETEQQAQRWLELVAQITDWTLERKEIVMALRGISVARQIGDALIQACEEVENATTD